MRVRQSLTTSQPARHQLAEALKVQRAAARRKSQGGFTLIELLIATALGLVLMGALASVVVTTMIAANTATGRVQASAQVRNFQLAASDDFALARPPMPSGCGTRANPCTTQDLLLQGSHQPALGGDPTLYTVRYVWDPSLQHVTRLASSDVGTSSRVIASQVTRFSWYVDSTSHATVVVNLTVTIPSYNATYSESQTFRFYPHLTPLPVP